MLLQKVDFHIDFYVDEKNHVIPNEIFIEESTEEDDFIPVVDDLFDEVCIPIATVPKQRTLRRSTVVRASQAISYREPVTQPLKASERSFSILRVILLFGITSISLAAFVLLGILGSTGKASQPTPDLKPAAPEPPQVKETETRSPLPHQTNQASTHSLQQVQRIAARAQLLSQSAQSVDDWKLVARQWQTAIGLLKAIPPSSSSYPAARQQLQRFNGRLANAARKANQAIVEAPTLAKADIVGGEVFCPASSRSVRVASVQSSSGQASSGQASGGQASGGQLASESSSVQPVGEPAQAEQPKVEITNVAFGESGAGVETAITGCITNHTNKPISQVAIVYKGTSAQVAGLVETGKEEVISIAVQPGATVGFRTRYTASPSISNLNIEAVSWTVAGQSEPQIAAATAQLVR